MPVSQTITNTDTEPPTPAQPNRSAAWGQAAARLVLTAAGVSLPLLAQYWLGPMALAVALPAAVAMLWHLSRPAGQAQASTTEDPLPGAKAVRLTAQVVPVWQRNVTAARTHAEQSMSALLESFVGVSGHLETALHDADQFLGKDIGAADELLAQHEPAIAQLAALNQQALQLQTELMAELQGFHAVLAEMNTLSSEVQHIGRATHLLALNISVEANRGSQGNAGSGAAMVVAQEVRALAAQSRDCGGKLARHVLVMQERLADVTRRHQKTALEDSESVAQHSDQAARAVVVGLLESMSVVTKASRKLSQAGGAVQSDLEKIFVALQSQDRFSQMLVSVTDDMARYGDWLNGAADPMADAPMQWLERLEASYTMEELRSSHHGNRAVDSGSTVEFF